MDRRGGRKGDEEGKGRKVIPIAPLGPWA